MIEPPGSSRRTGERRVRCRALVGVVAATALLVSCSDLGDDVAPSAEIIRPAAAGVPDTAALLRGVSTVTVRVTAIDGGVCEVCMWLADSDAERSSGLKGVTDLGDPVGMVFSWNDPTDSRFFMLDTPSPLSIAWFSAAGTHVGQADMAPCLTDDASTCYRYSSYAPYVLAVEMLDGELGRVGITPGTRVELVEGSERPGCLLTGRTREALNTAAEDQEFHNVVRLQRWVRR